MKTSKSVGFVALGCPKNMVDAEAMLAHIGMAGYVLNADPDNADIVVINTCGFIAPAKQEALDAIGRAIEQKKKGRIGKIIVTGCLSQRLGEELLDSDGQIDAIVGLAGRDSIEKVLRDIQTEQTDQPHLYLTRDFQDTPDDLNRLRITPAHWAYLRISEGCNRQCSFCTIPAIRGKFRSKPMDTLLEEARRLVDSGAVELSLIAQDSNFYGRDMDIHNGLVRLIQELEKINSLKWIRLMYLYPAGLDDSLISAIADSPKVVRYIDMPIQHISDEILNAMRRGHTQKSTAELIDRLRKAMPDVVLRTTVIAGFPGETESQFDQLLAFIRQTQFDALGCFPFYPEPGTPAALLDHQLPEEVRRQRTEKIMLTQQKIAFAKAQKRIGTRLMVLVDKKNKTNAIGRFYGQAPHIDSVCIIKDNTVKPGSFIRTDVTDSRQYDLLVKPAARQQPAIPTG